MFTFQCLQNTSTYYFSSTKIIKTSQASQVPAFGRTIRQAVRQRPRNRTLSCLLSVSDHLEVKVNLTAVSMNRHPRECVALAGTAKWRLRAGNSQTKGKQAKNWGKVHLWAISRTDIFHLACTVFFQISDQLVTLKGQEISNGKELLFFVF